MLQISKTLWRRALALAGAAFLVALALPGATNTQEGSGEAAFKEVSFVEDFLNDPDNIATGKAIWDEQCKLCHGKTAYPGKGPRLKPRKYSPEFVYKRVTKGFRGMPSWAEVYDEHQRMSVTAFVMSKGFSN